MNNLRKARKLKGLKQQEVAKLLNITHSTLSKWETESHQPDMENLVKLAKIYNVTIDYLLGNADYSKPSQPNNDDPIINEKHNIAEKILNLDIDQARAIGKLIDTIKK